MLEKTLSYYILRVSTTYMVSTFLIGGLHIYKVIEISRGKRMAGKNIKVSVVVATYNHEKYIRHTLESIVSQKTDFDYEVIVGDDCSSDGTAEIVREYASKYPELIIPVIREKNMGGTSNLLDLLARIRGEYVAFIEGDDYWIDENKLQKQADFLDSHSDYIACFGHCIIVDENENRNEELEKWSGFMKRGGDYTIKDFEEYILPGQTATSMYRKIAYAKLQQKVAEFKIDVSDFIDRDQVLLMLSVGKMYNLGTEVSAYRYVVKPGAGSWSSENDFYSFRTLMNYLDGLKKFEKLAQVLGMKLNFDERRKYEWRKLEDSKKDFSKENYRTIKAKLIDESIDKKKIKAYITREKLKSLLK